MNLTNDAKKLLKARYCKNGESPEDVFERIANYIGNNRKQKKDFKRIMKNKEFLPNSPTIRNAGRNNHCLSACFVLPIHDNMESIFKTLKDSGIIFKHGGGVGMNWSEIRPKGSSLSGGGEASGVVSFMRMFDAMTNAVKQGGFRRGAQMNLLNIDHPEIIDFVKEKIEKRNLTNSNLSVRVTDHHMKEIENDGYIRFRDPKTKQFKGGIRASTIFQLITTAAWMNGDPGLQFHDRINEDNNTPENPIIASNPCQPKDALLLDGDKLRYISDKKSKTWESWYTGKKEVLLLTCNNGLKLKFTPEHKLMLENEKFIQTKNALNKNLKWGLGNRKVKSEIKDFVLKGLLFGDGFLCAKKQGVSVKLNKFKEEEFAKYLLNYGFNQQESGAFYINRKNLPFNVDFLEKRVWDRSLPKEILLGNSNIAASFLKGLFEANGSVSIIKQISLKATNLNMIEDVQKLLASFGIISWVIKNKPSTIKWKNGLYTSKKSYNLQIAPRNTWIFKEKIGFLSKRKNNKIKFNNKSYKNKLKVVKITSLGIMNVYDYKMKEPPHYNLCQGIIAKNCGEENMHNYESCTLGSINLSKCVTKKGNLSKRKLKELIELGTKFLLNVNEKNYFPVPECEKALKKYNRIGLGIMGFADMLCKMGVHYDSKATLKIIKEIGKMLQLAQSIAIDSASTLTVAPTGSLSILANTSSGIEPYFSRNYIRKLSDDIGEVTENRYNKYVRTAHEISPDWHLKIQIEFQKWIDNSISKTINLPNDADIDTIKDVYIKAWKGGCKGITVFRDGCKGNQVYNNNKCEGESCYL